MRTVHVLPACAGMIPTIRKEGSALDSAPRMRGDDPEDLKKAMAYLACSPHARG